MILRSCVGFSYSWSVPKSLNGTLLLQEQLTQNSGKCWASVLIQADSRWWPRGWNLVWMMSGEVRNHDSNMSTFCHQMDLCCDLQSWKNRSISSVMLSIIEILSSMRGSFPMFIMSWGAGLEFRSKTCNFGDWTPLNWSLLSHSNLKRFKQLI